MPTGMGLFVKSNSYSTGVFPGREETLTGIEVDFEKESAGTGGKTDRSGL
jgi:hypothetical protein